MRVEFKVGPEPLTNGESVIWGSKREDRFLTFFGTGANTIYSIRFLYELWLSNFCKGP